MTVLAPRREAELTQPRTDALIKEARRHRRRRLLVSGVAVLVALGTYLVANSLTSSARPTSLLARPLHYPSLGTDGSCPTSAATTQYLGYFHSVAFGSGSVKLVIDNEGDLRRGRVDLGKTEFRGWFALDTLWFSSPKYTGPFVVRATRLGAHGPVRVFAAGQPIPGPLVVPSGPAANTKDGYRAFPEATWVATPGCYAWQVDGRSFSEVIVVDAMSH